MLSSGARVPLILDPAIKIRGSVRGIGGIGIYPGAIVALKGKNGGGGYFLAIEVLGVSAWGSLKVLMLTIDLDSTPQTVAFSARNHQSKVRS